MSRCPCVVGGKTLPFTDLKLKFFRPPEPLLSRWFVLLLISALRAATKTPLAFMRLMKVSERGAVLLQCVCVQAVLGVFTGTS